MYRLNQLKLNINHTEDDFRKKIEKIVGTDKIDWATLIILHRAIDARVKKNILYVYNIAFNIFEDIKHFDKINNRLEVYVKNVFNPIVKMKKKAYKKPIVVGFGPAGIFASYILALNGMKPIVIERGKAIEDRTKDVYDFFDTMKLNENSNVCFGEGGAGAFSDGKLNTNNKDRYGIYHFVLETFVKHGADKTILYDNLPHIGTDKLTDVIKNIRNDIIKLGGEIYYSTKFSIKNGVAKIDSVSNNDSIKNDVVSNITITDETPIVLAIGNSSRETFNELIDNNFDVKAKAIAVGYRIAHRQSFINQSQYGEYEKNNNFNLPNATYKLVCNINKKSVYSFCMCPGGYIINSSNFEKKLAINGMSYNSRNGMYANSAIVVTVTPDDLINSDVNDPKCMISFQEFVEKKAYEMQKGYIPYKVYGDSNIDEKCIFKGKARECNELLSIYENCGVKFNINEYIEMALNKFNKSIKGFCESEYVLAGVETRTSSPVKLDRDENYMCNIKNYFPCGEGLGHGGGIMSSAVDGINVAMKILNLYT